MSKFTEMAESIMAEKFTKAEEMTPTQRLATELHRKNCRSNHTDQCDWEYDVKSTADGEYHNWTGFAHRHWLRQAEEVEDATNQQSSGSSESLEI